MRYNNTSNPLPEMFRGASPFMVNTLLEIGYAPDRVVVLLRYADDNGDHPDWSEDSQDEIADHFRVLEVLMAEEVAR